MVAALRSRFPFYIFLYSDLHIELKEMLHLPRSNANQFMVSVQILYWRMNLLWRNDVRAESS